MDIRATQLLLAKRVNLAIYFFVLFIIVIFQLIADILLPPVEYGCTSNNDCPDYTACQNRKCINPCAADNICAPNAICTVTRHKAVCACPDGYIGSPEITCTLRKYLVYFWYLGIFTLS